MALFAGTAASLLSTAWGYIRPYAGEIISLGLTGIGSYYASKSQEEATEANVKTEERRQKIAEENERLADLEAVEQALGSNIFFLVVRWT